MKNNATKKRILFLGRIPRLIRAILSAYIPHEAAWISSASSNFFEVVRRLEKERGIEFTVKYIKTCRNYITRALSGHPSFEDNGVALDANGIPKAFAAIYYQAIGSNDRIRILLSLFMSLRSITLKPNPDLSTIENPFNGVDNITDSELAQAFRMLGVKRTLYHLTRKGLVKTDWTEHHLTTKKGPQGHALLNSMLELTLLTPQLIQYIKVLGGNKLGFYLESMLAKGTEGRLAAMWSSVFKSKAKRDGSLRKISYFSDKEGKTRVIALVDYWSQASLKPLHILLNRILRRIPRDCTFNQGAFLEFSSKDSEHSFHSLDLSAATDRMPVALQERVIASIIGAEKASAWRNILTELPFHITLPDKTVKLVRYGAGQPMGAYSSWPAMALTHHVLVMVAAQRAGFSSFSDYFILGDDLVISHDKVAESYLTLIATLDMPYSKEKTHTSKEMFEFAKRWFNQGVEVSGFPLGGLMSTYNRYPLLANFIVQLETKNWILPLECHSSLIRAIFSVMKEGHYIVNKVESSIKLYMVFMSLLRYKMDPSNEQVYSTFFEKVSAIADPQPLLGNFPSPKAAFYWLLLKARLKLMKSDQERLLANNESFMFTLMKHTRRPFNPGGLGGPARNLLRLASGIGVSSARGMSVTDLPIQGILSRKIRSYRELIHSMTIPDSNMLLPSAVIIDGLGKYMIGKEIFSMRTNASIALAESAIVKQTLSVIKEGYKPDPDIDRVIAYSIETDPHTRYMMSGLPILAVGPYLSRAARFLAPNLSRVNSWKSFVALAARRGKGLVGLGVFTGFVTLCTSIPTTVHCIVAIISALNALFGVNTIAPGVSEPLTSIIGNYLFRLVELLLLVCGLSIYYQWDVFSLGTEMIWFSYTQGITTLGETVLDFSTLVTNLVIKTSNGLTGMPVETLISRAPNVKEAKLFALFTLEAGGWSILSYFMFRLLRFLIFGS
jgi:hypothetical protein